jgi:fatty acid desaturase
MAALIACFLVAIGLALMFTLGAPWLVFIPIILVGLIVFWLIGALASDRTPSPQQAVRRTRKAELLGPGGPDDPDRA